MAIQIEKSSVSTTSQSKIVEASPKMDRTEQGIKQIAQKMQESGFSPETRLEVYKGWRETVSVDSRYIKAIGEERRAVAESFDGGSLESRLSGMQRLMRIRKEMAVDLFKNVVKPEVEALMRLHGDHRSFDEAAAVFGFNRLFTRDFASAGTDIDFMLTIDTTDTQLIKEIQFFMKEIVRPKMRQIGVDMEAADYLMGDLATYLPKLDNTRKSLFTLANVNNIYPIAGSKAIIEKMFSFSDQQLVEHFTNFISNVKHIENKERFKENLLKKLADGDSSCRNVLIQHLRRMANSELYIGRKPYDNKKTVQTVFAKEGLQDKIDHRAEKFSIKYCLNRIVDIHAAAKIRPEGMVLTTKRLETIEQLALLLSNIACRLDTKDTEHPGLTLQEGYSDISLKQMAKMNAEERREATLLLEALEIVVKPEGEHFAESLYDSLWLLGRILCSEAKQLEMNIVDTAYLFATSEE